MKEFVIKHPFITFLIVDEICVTVQNCVQMIVNKSVIRNSSITRRVVKDAVDAIHEVSSEKGNEDDDTVKEEVEVEEDE